MGKDWFITFVICYLREVFAKVSLYFFFRKSLLLTYVIAIGCFFFVFLQNNVEIDVFFILYAQN